MCGAPMTQCGSRSGVEDGGEELPLHAQGCVPDGVDPRIDAMQSTGCNPAGDRRLADGALGQLPVGNYAPLPLGETRDASKSPGEGNLVPVSGTGLA